MIRWFRLRLGSEFAPEQVFFHRSLRIAQSRGEGACSRLTGLALQCEALIGFFWGRCAPQREQAPSPQQLPGHRAKLWGLFAKTVLLKQPRIQNTGAPTEDALAELHELRGIHRLQPHRPLQHIIERALVAGLQANLPVKLLQ